MASASKLLVLHGAGSRGRSHTGFRRRARARGFDATCPDLPGHGSNTAALDAGLLEWAESRVAGPTLLRGSSLGGWLVLHLAARSDAVRAVVAIAPTSEPLMLERFPSWEADVDAPSFRTLLEGLDVDAAAAAIRVPVLYVHARDDERIPLAHTERLHGLTRGSELVALDAGGHSGPSHDRAVHELTLDWLDRYR